MTFYAHTTARRTRQILADVVVMLWIGVWVWVGRQVHDTVLALRSPADAITSAGTTVRDALTGAGDSAGGLPLVGDQLRQWLGQAAGSGTSLRDAGTSMADTVETLAVTLGLCPSSSSVEPGSCCECGSSGVQPPRSGSSTPAPTSTSSPCAPWRDVR